MIKFKAKHFMVFLISTTLVSLKGYTSLFIQKGGRNSWVITIFCVLITVLFANLILSTLNKSENYDFKEIIYSVTGKFLGNIFMLLFLLCLILNAIECASVESSTIHTNFFLETPPWFVLIFFILSALYCLHKPLDALLIVVLVAVAIIIFNGSMLAILVEKYKDYKNLFPVFQSPISLPDIKCTILQLGAMSSFFICIPLTKNVIDKKNIKKYSLLSFILIGEIMIFAMIGAIATFGPNRAANIFYPKLIQSQRVYYGGFLENGELYVLFQAIISWFLKYIISVFIALELLKDKVKNRKLLLLGITMVIFIASYFLSKNIFILFKFLSIFQYINFVILFLIPLIIYSIYNVKYKKYVKDNKLS